MLTFKQYIKELMGPSHSEPREDGISNADKRDLADIIDNRSGIQRSIDRQTSPHGVIKNLPPPNPNSHTPILNPNVGDHVRDTKPEYGSGRMKIYNDGNEMNE